MANQNKSRLSDITKQSATDRASKLVTGFMPPPPTSQPVTQESDVAKTAVGEATPDPVMTTTVTDEPVATAVTTETSVKAKGDRPKRAAAPTNFIDLITQPLPAGLRCDKPIMIEGSQHRLLRELSFNQNKPMTEILYNLLEYATQAYQRDRQAHV